MTKQLDEITTRQQRTMVVSGVVQLARQGLVWVTLGRDGRLRWHWSEGSKPGAGALTVDEIVRYMQALGWYVPPPPAVAP
jgi:hypothetical protein